MSEQTSEGMAAQSLEELWQYSPEQIRKGAHDTRKEVNKLLGTDVAQSLTYGVLCSIMDGVTTREGLHQHLDDMFAFRLQRISLSTGDIDEAIQHAIYEKLIVTSDGEFSVTQRGRELLYDGRRDLLHVGYWMTKFFKEKMVLAISALSLVFLVIVKLWVGTSINSGALVTDGLENFMDIIVVVIIGLSLRYKKDRLGAIAIMIFMLISGGLLAFRGILALLENAIVEVNVWGFAVVGLSLLLNLGLMYYKAAAGRMSGNLALISDAKEDGSHLKIGAGVIIGLTFAVFNIHFVDSIVAVLIAGWIFWEGIRALRELVATGGEFNVDTINLGPSDFFEDIIVYWILSRLTKGSATIIELNEDFLRGVAIGYRYYDVHAVLGYHRLEERGITRNIEEAIRNGFIEVREGQLSITRLGLAAYYKNRSKELSQLADTFARTRPSLVSIIKLVIVLVAIGLFVVYAPVINAFLAQIPSLFP